MSVRTRFAPSPTGFMHIGNLRSALYSYLIAKSLGGKFILRIEDTDQKRQVSNAENVIYDTLRRTGLFYDEGPDIGGNFGPYVQSQRKEIYIEYANKLVTSGDAYRCFCGKNESNSKICECCHLSNAQVEKMVNENRSYVIRQRMPDQGATGFDDVVFGHIEIENNELEDQILIKSDGFPTYNFANVIDDHLMNITHVVRGCEYLSSTPKYNLLYNLFGWDIPVYIHLPLIMGKNPDGSITKLSKRAGAISFVDLIDEGYLPDAIINYIAFLGWCPESNNEIFSLKELEESFSIDRIGKSPSVFDYEKLSWVNEQHLKMMSNEHFETVIKRYINFDIDICKLSNLLKKRITKLTQIPDMVSFLNCMPKFDLRLFLNKKNKSSEENVEVVLKRCIDVLSATSDWSNDSLYKTLIDISDSINLKKNTIMWIVRIAISGQEVTPGGATEILEILGKSKSLDRINKSLKKWIDTYGKQ